MKVTVIRTAVMTMAIFMLYSCASRLHQHYEYSSSATDVYTTISNDSIGFSIRTPADIQFFTTEQQAQKFLRKEWELNKPENVILVGKTKIEPMYSFIIVMDSPSLLDHGNYSGIRVHTFERMIGGHKINLIAHGEKPNIRPDDFIFMLDNLSFSD